MTKFGDIGTKYIFMSIYYPIGLLSALIIGKNNKIQRNFEEPYNENRMSDLAQILEL
jgi:hypothetical protein